MTDGANALVERLRWGEWYFEDPFDGKAYASDDPLEAADLIETQAREIERLRGALKEIMDLPGEINPSNYDHVDVCELNRQFCLTYEIARAALGDSHED